MEISNLHQPGVADGVFRSLRAGRSDPRGVPEEKRRLGVPRRAAGLLLHRSRVSGRNFCFQYFLVHLRLRPRAGLPQGVRRHHSYVAQSRHAHCNPPAAPGGDVPSASQTPESFQRNPDAGALYLSLLSVGVVDTARVRDLGLPHHGPPESCRSGGVPQRGVSQHGSCLPAGRETHPPHLGSCRISLSQRKSETEEEMKDHQKREETISEAFREPGPDPSPALRSLHRVQRDSHLILNVPDFIR